MPYRDPHTSSPCLWAIRYRDGPYLQISRTAPPQGTDSQQRKAIKTALIALHRLEHEQSPKANFGRTIPGYRQSSFRREGVLGGPLVEDEPEPNPEPENGVYTTGRI